jgi:toxin-antitoxin system, antitoxin component, xre family
MDIGYHNFIKLSILFLKIRRKNMAKTKFKGNFKEILKELRKKKNLTQRELAEKTGISLAMITKYEQGLNTPSIENLRVLADFFKVPLREFLEDRNSDRFFKDFFSEKEANIDIENYDFSTNDEKFLSISKGRQYIYHILKFLEAVGFEIYIDEEKNVFNIRSSDPEYLVNIYWTINNLQFQIQFLRNILIDYSYMFFKDMDNHIKKIENDNTENNNTKDFDSFKDFEDEE